MVTWAVVANSTASQSEKRLTQASINVSGQAIALNPVDKLTSSDVAVNVARAAGLEEATAVENQAQSAKVAVMMSVSDTNIAAKPQLLETTSQSWRDIKEYVVINGDTVSSIAQKFGIPSDSLKWSNNLNSDSVAAGRTLQIPPAEGIVYTVVAGDTPQTLAAKFRASADRIAADNDAEISGLAAGRKIFVAGGKIVAPTPPAPRTYTSTGASNVSGGFVPSYGANGYDFGWCTYYAAARSGAPGNWGNANTWAYYARLSGWNVSSTPSPGAIFQTPAGWAGHVGIVEEVYSNGTMRVSDMNGFSGFGSVGYATVPVSAYPNYISR